MLQGTSEDAVQMVEMLPTTTANSLSTRATLLHYCFQCIGESQITVAADNVRNELGSEWERERERERGRNSSKR